MNQTLFSVLVFSVLVVMSSAQNDIACANIFASNLALEDKQILCKLYQSSAVLSQLSNSVTAVMEQYIAKQVGDSDAFKPQSEKRKHEYLRFGRK